MESKKLCIEHVKKLYEIKDFYEMSLLMRKCEKVDLIETTLEYVISLIEEYIVGETMTEEEFFNN